MSIRISASQHRFIERNKGLAFCMTLEVVNDAGNRARMASIIAFRASSA